MSTVRQGPPALIRPTFARTMESYDHHQRQVSSGYQTSVSDEIENMHDVFSDPYRCAVLYCLQTSDEPVTVTEVASNVVEWSPEFDDVPADGVKTDGAGSAVAEYSRTWLLDNHILPMAAFGTIAYDPGRDVVHLPDDVSISVTAPWQE